MKNSSTLAIPVGWQRKRIRITPNTVFGLGLLLAGGILVGIATYMYIQSSTMLTTNFYDHVTVFYLP